MTTQTNSADEYSSLHPQIRELVAKKFLPVFICILFAYQLLILLFAITTAFIASPHSIEPRWWTELSPIVSWLGMSIASVGSSQYFDSFVILVTALFSGIFLHRCQRPSNGDAWIVIALIVLAAAQMLILHLLPDPESAENLISNGKQVTESLQSILKRNINVSIAICAAALGTNIIRGHS